jgi:serine acetyltransferase
MSDVTLTERDKSSFHAAAGARPVRLRRVGLVKTIRLIVRDCQAYAVYFNKPPTIAGCAGSFLHPGFISLALYRISRLLFNWRLRPAARLVYLLNLMITGSEISPTTVIGENCIILHTAATVLSGRIGHNVILTGMVGLGGDSTRKDIGAGPGLPVVEDGAILGARSTVLGPHRLGRGCFVCAVSFVITDVAPGATVFGNPAKPLRTGGVKRLKRVTRPVLGISELGPMVETPAPVTYGDGSPRPGGLA